MLALDMSHPGAGEGLARPARSLRYPPATPHCPRAWHPHPHRTHTHQPCWTPVSLLPNKWEHPKEEALSLRRDRDDHCSIQTSSDWQDKQKSPLPPSRHAPKRYKEQVPRRACAGDGASVLQPLKLTGSLGLCGDTCYLLASTQAVHPLGGQQAPDPAMLPTSPLCHTHPGGAELCSLPSQAGGTALGDFPTECDGDVRCTERKRGRKWLSLLLLLL